MNVQYLTPARLLTFLSVLLVWKVTLNIVFEYRDYLPPNFDADFLLGREQHFWGPYAVAFYTHLLSSPPALLIGTLLVSSRLRTAAPGWHRRLGRVQMVLVLLLVAPSGFWMAFYSLYGYVAVTGLAALAIATATCAALGWRAAVRRNWETHRRWMWRTFLLLCSAVVIRMIGGLATVAHYDAVWLYPLTTWISWLVPLAVYECGRAIRFMEPPMVASPR